MRGWHSSTGMHREKTLSLGTVGIFQRTRMAGKHGTRPGGLPVPVSPSPVGCQPGVLGAHQPWGLGVLPVPGLGGSLPGGAR